METNYIVLEAKNPKVKAPRDLVSAEAVTRSSLGKSMCLELSVREDGGHTQTKTKRAKEWRRVIWAPKPAPFPMGGRRTDTGQE